MLITGPMYKRVQGRLDTVLGITRENLQEFVLFGHSEGKRMKLNDLRKQMQNLLQDSFVWDEFLL